MVSRISGSPPRAPQAQAAKQAEAKQAQPPQKPITGADVVQSRELATRYTLDTNNLPFRSTEEVLEYIQHNVDAMKGKGPADPKTRERIGHNLHFAIAELENRLPHGKLRDQLYAARQAVSRGDEVDKPALKEATRAVGAFIKSQQIDPESSKWSPAVFEPAAQLGRLRGPLESFDWHLGRIPTIGFDEPDFQKKMPNLVAQLNVELAKVTLPTDPQAKQVFGRAVSELTAQVKSVMQTAEARERPDIVDSGKQALELLAKLAAGSAA